MKRSEIVHVSDVMVGEFDIVEGVATIAEAIRSARYLDNECIIVNRRHDNDEYGILLLSDIAKSVIAADKAAERINVYEIMSKPVIYVNPNMDIRYCARLFKKFGLNRAPVVKNREVLGVISYKDMVLKGLKKSLSVKAK